MNRSIAGRRLQIIIVVLLGLALILFFYRVRAAFAPFILAIIMSYLINPVVCFLERKGAPRGAGTFTVYVVVTIGVALIIAYLFPVLARELQRLVEVLPAEARWIQKAIDEISHRYRRFAVPQVVRGAVDEGINRAESYLRQGVRAMVEATLGLFSKVLSLLIAPVLAFYMTRDAEHLKTSLMSLIPGKYRADVLELLREIDKVLSAFIRGQLMVSAIVGALTAVGLSLMRVDLALIIGIIAGVLDIIPYFGPILGLIPAIAVSLPRSPWLSLYVALLFAAIHQFEGSVLIPKVLGDQIGLHPLVVIFALLVGGQLGGLVGLLVAVPVAGVLKVVASFVWERVWRRTGW